MQWLVTVSVSTGTALPASTRFLQSVWFRPSCHSSADTEVAWFWWLHGTPGPPGCPSSFSRPEITYICGRPRTSSADKARSSTGWGPPHVGPPFFLRTALLASRLAEVVDTLLACYRPSSQRQQEVAWTAFRHWLPRDRSSVTKDDVLAFLQYLFSARSLAPTSILNYRAALQWPLEEAFAVDFSHPAFSRLPLDCSTSGRPRRLWFTSGTCRPSFASMKGWIPTPVPSGSCSSRPCVSRHLPWEIGARN